MSTNKVKIGELTKQMSESAEALLNSVRRQQQQWRAKAQNLKRMEIALQKQAEQQRAEEREAAEALARQMQENGEEQPAEAEKAQPAVQPAAQAAEVSAPEKAEPAAVQEPAPVQETQPVQKAEEKETEAQKPAEVKPEPVKQEKETRPKKTEEPAQKQETVKKTETQGPKVLDFRTQESRDRSRPQRENREGPVYVSRPDARSTERTDRPQRRERTDRQDRPQRPAREGQQAGGPRYSAAQAQPASPDRNAARGGAKNPRKQQNIASQITPVQEKRGGSNYDPNRNQYSKKGDQEKRGLNRRQQIRMNGEPMSFGDDDNVRNRKVRRKKKEETRVIEPIKIDHAVMATETISVKDLSEKIGRPVAEIIKKLFLLGIMATINNEIDFDTASLVCSEFDVELEQKIEKTTEEVLMDDAAQDAEEDLKERPPVVTIMGHVVHGKTSLLDMIRKTHVTATEAGGITQHIGAYSVTLNGRRITFLDTPGHEAFTAMRMRGAQATDIAVLVVAADDGIMPQTIEAINHSKAAGVSIIVAINKIDRPAANVDRVMQQLTEYGLVPEEWGGDTICVPVSAHTGENIDRLLEMILLDADMLELKANPDRRAVGIIIEAKLDKGRGPVATVLVKNGTLHVGDTIVAGLAYGRVRAMQNEQGARVTAAGPSDPVEVIGFSDVPEAGDNLYAVEEGSISRQVAEERRDRIKAEQLKAQTKVSLDDLFSQIEQGNIKELNVIVKADVQGSVEAVRSSLEKISNEEVRVRTIHGGVGAITASDVMLAAASNAIIVGFNVRPQPQAKEAAEHEDVDIRLYRVIYQAIEDIEAAIHGMLAPVYEEVVLGHAEVRETYHVSRVGTIAGCYVMDGKITRTAKARVIRDDVIIREADIASLRRFKDDVREVATGYECGISLVNYNDIKVGDQIEVFENQEVEA